MKKTIDQFAFKYLCLRLIFLMTIAGSLVFPVNAQDRQATTQWKGFSKVNVVVDGHEGYYVKPLHPLPGNPWVWRSSFPDWHTDIDSILLSGGFYVAYINVDNQYGSPYSMLIWDKFYSYLTHKIKLAAKPGLEAVSRGALYAYGWAKRNPDKVSCIYAETPVCDVKSWPGGKGVGLGDTASWAQFKRVFHFTEQQAIAYNDNPIDNLEGLASFHVSVLHTISLDDKLTPPAENTYVFAQRYLAVGGPISIHPVTIGPQELHGHHFPIDRPGYYADFIFNNCYPVKNSLPYGNYIDTANKLSNFVYAARVKKKATVAFLGGSITYNPGWRPKACKYLEERFPNTEFHFIAAGIPSLGSLPHAFRLQRDVLDSGKVDLLFVEATVNDRTNGTDSLTQVRALEGIIRHAKTNNPQMDIVTMAFADPDETSDYDKGIIPTEVNNHQLVANHYNLPFINLAKEVRDKIRAGEFTWDDDFKDLHPAIFGQELYFETIKDLLQACFENTASGETTKAKLPKPLNKGSLENGSYFNIKNAVYDKAWSINPNWKPADGLGTRDGFVNVPVLSADKPGATLSLRFKGAAAGIAIVSGADAGTISYSIDNGPVKNIDLYTEWSGFLHLPWYLLLGSDLTNGNHTLKITINDLKNKKSIGHACRIVNFLVNK
ncbi:MAG TPA: GDSL-type esterase/lipase family protein [Mucilaginibacter sp.]|nr:GDSL-type esterase/lipase family protein [Mucilaginibacter sp.]